MSRTMRDEAARLARAAAIFERLATEYPDLPISWAHVDLDEVKVELHPQGDRSVLDDLAAWSRTTGLQATATDEFESLGRLVTSHALLTEIDGVRLRVMAYVSEELADERTAEGGVA